jgi:hypothetical protein
MARTSFIISIIEEIALWVLKVANFHDYQELKSDLEQDEIEGQFRVTTFQREKASWWNGGFYAEIPEIISHYLKLNLTFVAPTWNFNFTSKKEWSEITMSIMNQQNIDYILDPVFLSQELFHPQAFTLSSGLYGLDKICVITKKQLIAKTAFGEAKIFDTNVWWFFFGSIIIIAFFSL